MQEAKSRAEEVQMAAEARKQLRAANLNPQRPGESALKNMVRRWK